MRMRKKHWTEQELQTNPYIIKQATEKKGNWSAYFGNDNDIYVEIGCGKGNFIIENAKRYTNINFIALERQASVIAVAARKVENLPNLALVCDNAALLSDLFEKGEIKRIYLNFSDPWPKKGHAKRRLTHRTFLQSYRDVLGEQGEVFFKTDNKQLFEFSLNEFCADKWELSHICFDLHNSEYAEQNIMTEYEQKFSEKGMPIYRLEARYNNMKM